MTKRNNRLSVYQHHTIDELSSFFDPNNVKYWMKLTHPLAKKGCKKGDFCIAGCYCERRCAFVTGYRHTAARLPLAAHNAITLK